LHISTLFPYTTLFRSENKPFDFDSHPRGENSFTFKLPNSGVVITYKILNQVDQQAIEAELKQLKKMFKESSKELTTRLKYIITSDRKSTRLNSSHQII